MKETSEEVEYRTIAGDDRRLQGFLARILDLTRPELGRGVRCYGTTTSPTQQMKNKLSQAQSSCRDGLLHINLADEESHRQALAALRERWEQNPQWAKLSAVALAYPDAGGTHKLASVVVHNRRPFLNRLGSAFPSTQVFFTDAGSAESPLPLFPTTGSALPEDPGANVWIELFAGGTHGGAGWAHGQTLWSPTRDKGGADRYAPMRSVVENDFVLHSVAGEIVGFSRAAGTASEVAGEPPDAGKWKGMSPYYRIDLRDYRSLEKPVSLTDLAGQYASEILQDLREPDRLYYPFCEYGGGVRTNQGMYLTRASPFLYGIVARQNDDQPVSSADSAEDLFLGQEEFERMLSLLKDKKNVVLQGPPGVGKTLVGERLAWALLEDRDTARIGFVQFHQSYAYEDFVQGFRPTDEGGFARRDGVFLRFCDRARKDSRPHVFVIDEINRGNLSKIFGELMLLIEPDKRDRPISLAYHRAGDVPFSVPRNVFVVGLMNTADRSLALVDYALRRRFAFVTLKPQIQSPRFRRFLDESGVASDVADAIVSRIGELNRSIREDTRYLGAGFEIGHSFFCGFDRSRDAWSWYRRVIANEIGPLLEEYWYDDPEKARERTARLLE